MDRETRRGMKHDKFVDEVGNFYDDVRKNSQRVVAGVIGVLVIIAIGIGFWGWSARKEQAAQLKLADAIDSFSKEVGTAPAQPGQEAPKFKTEADKIAVVEPMLKDIVTNYSGTDAAQIANLYMAQILLEKGKNDEALKLFEEFVKKNPENLLAGGAQMSVYELKMASNPQSVIPELEKASQAEKSLLPKEALLSLLAQAYEKSGDKQKSMDLYRRIATEHPESPYAADAQQKISRG